MTALFVDWWTEFIVSLRNLLDKAVILNRNDIDSKVFKKNGNFALAWVIIIFISLKVLIGHDLVYRIRLFWIKRRIYLLFFSDLVGDVDTNAFYRYMGSLTTPTCNESVRWTVFADTIKINARYVSFTIKFYNFGLIWSPI